MLLPNVLHCMGRSLANPRRNVHGGPVCLEAHRYMWHTVTEEALVPKLMKTYFDANVEPQTCDLFLIDGVPAASLVYVFVDPRGSPLVDEVYLNKGLIMMFDAGPTMRARLWERYGSIHVWNAARHADFLII